jgi:predicted CopG family antitoxin
MSLIYDFSVYKVGNLSYNYNINGFRFTTEKGKASKTLKEFHTLLYETSYTFLKSKRGKEWFDDVISTYIFPRTTRFNDELAEDAVVSLLEDEDIFNTNIAVREAKKITRDDIKEYLQYRLGTQPHIWVESDMTKEEMEKVIKESPFVKKSYRV